MRRLDPHQFRRGTGAADHGQIAVVEGLDQHRLVARLQEGEDAGRQGLGGARGDHDLSGPVDLEAVETLAVLGHGLAQLGHPHHRRILVGGVLQGIVRRLAHVVGPVAVGKALSQIDRLVLDGQPRHHLEDGGAVTGKNAVGRFHADPPLTSTIIGRRQFGNHRGGT